MNEEQLRLLDNVLLLLKLKVNSAQKEMLIIFISELLKEKREETEQYERNKANMVLGVNDGSILSESDGIKNHAT